MPSKKTKSRKKKQDLQRKLFKQFCKTENLPAPECEYMFHDTRRWRIDYYFQHKNRKVALEVEGGVWSRGRHVRPTGFIKDMEKYNQLSCYGIYLLRVTPQDLLTVDTVKLIKKVLFEESKEND